MRQVFTSPRLENVERVARMLEEQGIEARITNGRSYRGNRRGNFSYREADSQPQPAVWVVKSEDQPKARELLREIGLLDSGRSPTTYLPTSVLERDRAGADDAGRKRMFRLKMGLLLGIAAAMGLGLFAWRSKTTAVPASTASAPTTAAPTSAASAASATRAEGASAEASTPTYVVETPSALAAKLIAAELGAHDDALLCLSVDGADPSARVIEQLPAAAHARIRPRSTCTATGDAALAIEVREYRTDGSGGGTVLVEIADTGPDGRPRTQRRTLEVRRDDLEWRIERVVL
ncbi:MAG: hypothetical protein ACOY82_01670 [Pseudomonadota bacterium]